MHHTGLLYLPVFTSSLLIRASLDTVLSSDKSQHPQDGWKSVHCHRLGLAWKKLYSLGLSSAKDFSFEGWFPFHFIKPHSKVYWNWASNRGKRKRKEEWEERKKREGRRREIKEGKDWITKGESQSNLLGVKWDLPRHMPSRNQSLESAMCVVLGSPV